MKDLIVNEDEKNILDQNPAMVYLTSLPSKRSQRVMRIALRSVLAAFYDVDVTEVTDESVLTAKWPEIRFSHTQALRAKLLQGSWSASTTNRILAGMRGVLKECWRLGLMSAEDYQKAIDVKNVTVQTIPAGRDIEQGEILALVAVCDRDEILSRGVQDAAIIGVLHAAGLRRAEVVSLDLEDVDLKSGKVQVLGKGNKQRLVYLNTGALIALMDWIILRGTEQGPLFLPLGVSGRIIRERKGVPVRLTAQTIYGMLQRRAQQAGVPHMTPHDFRRTLAGNMLDSGVDLATVQKFMGHASPITTSNYDRRGERTKRDAANMIHFPYIKRNLSGENEDG